MLENILIKKNLKLEFILLIDLWVKHFNEYSLNVTVWGRNGLLWGVLQSQKIGNLASVQQEVPLSA